MISIYLRFSKPYIINGILKIVTVFYFWHLHLFKIENAFFLQGQRDITLFWMFSNIMVLKLIPWY
jgi:hypothetical protein